MNQEIYGKLTAAFKKYFGNCDGTRLYFAPGRVNLIGEHTDYNGGHVFPCALSMGTYGLVRPREDEIMHFYSVNLSNMGVIAATLPFLEYDKRNGWANYLIGSVWAFLEKGINIDHGFDLVIYGDIPAGSGLSSSASIEVLMGTILKSMFGLKDLSMVDVALLGQRSENDFNGLNSGIMDQFASANGRKDSAIFLDTATLNYTYAPVVLEDAKIMIVNSKVKHSLVDSAYNDRRRESNAALKALQTKLPIKGLGDLTEEEFEANKDLITDPIQLKRAKHAVYENQRTIHAVEALKKNDIETFGKLMSASHISLRDDYEVSCKEVDALVEIEWSIPGVIGARITGGGFGGCTVAIVKNDAIENFRKTVLTEYKKATGINAEIYEAEINDGAGELTV